MREHGYRRRVQQQVAWAVEGGGSKRLSCGNSLYGGVDRRDKLGLWRPYRIPSPASPYSLAATKPTTFDSDCICLMILPTSSCGRLGGKAHDRIGAFARRAGKLGSARTALLFNNDCRNHGRLHQNRNGGGGCRPGKRARSKARQELRDAAAEVEPAAVARRPRLLGIDRGEQPLHRARRWRTECLIQVDRLDKLLADQIILPRQFAVAGERLLHAIGVAAAYHGSRASIS